MDDGPLLTIRGLAHLKHYAAPSGRPHAVRHVRVLRRAAPQLVPAHSAVGGHGVTTSAGSRMLLHEDPDEVPLLLDVVHLGGGSL